MSLLKYFWADAINTACRVLNSVVIRPILDKAPYELLKGKTPYIPYFRVFDYKCFILNNEKENLSKFDAKSNEGIFLGYPSSSKAYRVYNYITKSVEESISVTFYETKSQKSGKGSSYDVLGVITKTLVNENIPKRTFIHQ